MKKKCTKCNRTKLLTSFTKHNRSVGGRHNHCKRCLSKSANEWRKANPERYRDAALKRKFGISFEQYTVMRKAQNDLCAICKQPNSDGKALAVDHNHATDEVRELLCGNCNRGIGNLRENPAIIFAAFEYLLRHADKDSPCLTQFSSTSIQTESSTSQTRPNSPRAMPTLCWAPSASTPTPPASC